jgi:hypothetical protein
MSRTQIISLLPANYTYIATGLSNVAPDSTPQLIPLAYPLTFPGNCAYAPTATSPAINGSANFIIQGINQNGVFVTDTTLEMPSDGETNESDNAFLQIDAIYTTVPFTDLSFGFGIHASSGWIQLGTNRQFMQTLLQCVCPIDGSATCSVYATADPLNIWPQNSYSANPNVCAFPADPNGSLSNVSTNVLYYLTTPTSAVQLTSNSNLSGPVTLTIVQQGE